MFKFTGSPIVHTYMMVVLYEHHENWTAIIE